MKKRILPLILFIALCTAIFQPICVDAVALLDADAQASLKLHYQKDTVAFSDLQIGIYRVAEALPDGSFQLVEPFASYPINIYGISKQEQWHQIAQTLYSYIVANQVKADVESLTDTNGVVCFSNLKTGLYFVREVVVENTRGTYVFNQFMVYVPTPLQDGSYQYAVEANPKCTSFVPKTQYSVTKLWQDGGNQNVRPKEITVGIYQDGVLRETQTLNADNDWTYTWYVSGEKPGKWTVAEHGVADDYKVTIKQNGSVFSVINAYETKSDTPQTGDSFTPLPWIMIMCISGIALLILGIYRRRRK